MLGAEKLERGLIKLQGEDSFKFLQGLVTNDVKLASKGIYCFLLTANGRYLFDFFLIELESYYIIDVALTQKDELLAKLMLYKMRSKLSISDVSSEYSVTYSRSIINDDTIFSYQDPRYTQLGFRSLMLKSNAQEYKEHNLYNQDKYNYSIVDGSVDMIKDKSIPIEYGIEHLHAISYIKGCYVGQEVISRTKYQGVIRKSIMKIELDRPCSGLSGYDIFQGSNKLGSICSSFENKAIALIRDENYDVNGGEPLMADNAIITHISKACWY